MKHVLALITIAALGACGSSVADAPAAPAATQKDGPQFTDGKADNFRPPTPSECSDDSGCGTDQACHAGHCVAVACDSPRDCGDREVCAHGKCTIAACDAELACGSDESCITGKCVPAAGSCIDELDCAADQACVLWLCVTPGCVDDSDCNQSVCVGGTCRDLTCDRESNCAHNEVCADGQCRVAQ